VAERAAAKVSRDPEVIGEAADFAVAELASRLDNVSPETPERVEFLIGDERPQAAAKASGRSSPTRSTSRTRGR